MASDLAMVAGRTGWTTSWPCRNASATGEQPVAWAPNTLYGVSSTRPRLTSSRNALSILTSCAPEATGTTICSRQPPAELLGDLEADGLGALRVVGPDVDVDEGPVLAVVGQLGGQPVHVVVAALHRDHGAAVDAGGDDLLRLQVGRDEHHRPDARPGRGGRDRVREVARGRAGEHLEAQLDRGRERDGHHPVLEGVGGVGPLVLDPQAAHPELAARAARRGPGGSSPARCWAWTPRPGAPAAGWRNARCWPGRPRWRPGPASDSRSGPQAARSIRRRRGWSPAGRSGRIPGSSAHWRSRTGTGKRVSLRVMCSRGEASLLICPSGRMAEGRTWHLSREWPRGHTSP